MWAPPAPTEWDPLGIFFSERPSENQVTSSRFSSAPEFPSYFVTLLVPGRQEDAREEGTRSVFSAPHMLGTVTASSCECTHTMESTRTQ